MSADSPSSTPFALLLNAISDGDGQRHEEGLFGDGSAGDGLDAALADGQLWQAVAGHVTEPEKLQVSHAQLTDAISTLIVASHSDSGSENDTGMSSVEVWHPSTGQKSYGKERRMLNPPPFLRVSGPLFPMLASATLSATAPDSHLLSSETHKVPLNPSFDADALSAEWQPASRKSERAQTMKRIRDAAVKAGFAATLPMERAKNYSKERDALKTGLAFPALWVAEDIDKEKSFTLQLALSEPGSEASDSLTIERQPAQVDEPVTIEDDHIDLARHLHAIAQESIEDPASTSADLDGPVRSAISPSWATFSSSPISIVSKPSKKTAKARSMATCLTESSSFSLWVRINSQTVRTKYMNLDSGSAPRLSARSGKWTPFHFEVIYRAPPPRIDGKAANGRFKLPEDDPHVITYGSVVCLIDSQTGVRSDAMKLVRVDRNAVVVGEGEGDPISELQRVGLVRLEANTSEDTRGGGRWYLSAPSARTGGGELLPPRTNSRRTTGSGLKEDGKAGSMTTPGEDDTLQTASERPKKRRKTQKNALAEAIVQEEQEGSLQPVLAWEMAERGDHKDVSTEEQVHRESGVQHGIVEQVEDHMCWVIGGVTSFSYAFAPAISPMKLPTHPLEHVPRALAPPTFQAESNSLEVVLSEFNDANHPHALEIYIGPLGPLSTSMWRSSATKEAASRNVLHEAIPLGVNRDSRRVWSSFPGTEPHVLVVIEMPSADEIIRSMQKLTNKARIAPVLAGNSGAPATAAPVDATLDLTDFATSTQEPWIQDFDTSGHELPTEMELHEAMAAVEPHASDGDLEAALRAVDTSQFDAFNETEGTATIDPHLDISSTLEQASGVAHDGSEQPPRINLHAPKSEESKGDLLALPVLLVRKADAMIFGLGQSVVAKRIGSDERGEPLWGLRVTKSS